MQPKDYHIGVVNCAHLTELVVQIKVMLLLLLRIYGLSLGVDERTFQYVEHSCKYLMELNQDYHYWKIICTQLH